MQSLQSRLSTGLLLSLIVSFSALWGLVSVNVQFLAEEYIASRLKHDADTLLNAINIDASKKKLQLDINRIDLVYQQPFSGHYYVVSTPQQRIQSRSLWDQQIEHDTIDTGTQVRSKQTGPVNQDLLVISNGYKKLGQAISISVAEDLDPINKNIQQFQYWFSLMSLAMLLLLVVLQAIILRYSLKPFLKIHTELQSLEQGQLEKLSTDTPAELRPLVNEVNHLLSVMKQRLSRSRNALGNLAHAIKKPLTVIQQLTGNNEIPDSSRQNLIQQTNEIYQLSDRILKRARLAGHSHSGALFSFSDDLPVLVKTLEMMHTHKSLQLTTNIADNIHCPIDREDMLELLGNLLDNAYKWASNKIILSVNTNSQIHIHIEDDGPGVDPHKLNELSKRGVRLDEKITGHGFGLAIAADIVSEYGGSIVFNNSAELNGFMIDISVPILQKPGRQ